jgi:Zn-dependent metalloprotease
MIYDARGAMHPLPGRLLRKEGAKPARDKSANQAYDNLGITLDFFRQVFKRDSLDGRGMDVPATVHFGDRWPNAMWNGEQMLFGDGDGEHILGFTQSLDIIAHELTHAVTQHSIPGGLGVVFKGDQPALIGEPGALNESISDVFASMAKQWHGKVQARDADWLLGEGILSPEIGKAVRSLKHPGRKKETYGGDNQVCEMRDFRKKADVHRNAGIANHAFYLAATDLGGYSWAHAGPIWYAALPLLKADSGFADAAKATLQAAEKLFGDASKEQRAVRKAWKKVGVLSR